MADVVSPLNLAFTTEEFNEFVDNLFTAKSQPDVPSTLAQDNNHGAEAETSSNTNLTSAYPNLPRHLKSCLDYCYFFLNCSMFYVYKDRLACLLLAEGLIKQDNSSTSKEDAASIVIDELIGLGMLENDARFFEQIRIPSTYKKLSNRNVDRKNHFAKAPDSAIRLCIVDGVDDNLYPNLHGLMITSLFDFRPAFTKCISRRDYMEKNLQIEISGCVGFDAPHRKIIFEERFEMMFCQVDELPAEVLDIQRLWHILINRKTLNSKVGVPRKIGLRLNLHTLSIAYGRGGITSELDKFTQLRRLEIYLVSQEHASELSAAIMKMTFLLSLSMYAEATRFGNGEKIEVVELFPELEAFRPPSRLQEVHLTGILVDIPSWVLSMENLSSLYLSKSNLHQDSMIILQFLPNLKHLHLINASKAKQIGEEFCQAGGFPKLEALSIHSNYLVEWSEIENGAFPSLRSLTFSYCHNLMFLPDGLQNLRTMYELYVYAIHGDLERRLQGDENYKIKNIPKVVFTSRR